MQACQYVVVRAEMHVMPTSHHQPSPVLLRFSPTALLFVVASLSFVWFSVSSTRIQLSWPLWTVKSSGNNFRNLIRTRMGLLIGKRYDYKCGWFSLAQYFTVQLLQAFNAVEEKKITGAEARDIIAAFDKNKDGTIKFDEFAEVGLFMIYGHFQTHKRFRP